MSSFSTLRRRVLGDSSSEPSRASSPNPAFKDKDGEHVTLVPTSKLKKLSSKRSKKRQWLVFGLGGLFGIVIAAFFAQQNDVINLEGLMDMNLDSLLEAIPAGIVKDAKDITVSLQPPRSFPRSHWLRLIGLVAARARNSQLRLICGRPPFAKSRRQSSASRHHDTWRHIYWSRKLGNRGGLKAVFQETTMGQL